MRQHASELVKRAEAGERLTITVSGRPAAVLGPVTGATWRRWTEVADIFAGASAGPWGDDDRGPQPAELDETLTDPWERR
jgi:prevent-host-death family protein